MRIFIYGIIGPTIAALLAMWEFSIAFGNGESISSAMGPMFAIFWILFLIPLLVVFALQRLLTVMRVFPRVIISGVAGFTAALGTVIAVMSVFQMKEGISPAVLFALAGCASAMICSLLLALTNKSFRSVSGL